MTTEIDLGDLSSEGIPIMMYPQFDAYRSAAPGKLFRRYSEEAYAQDFVQRGEVRFKTISYYRALDFAGDKKRGDREDGSITTRLLNPRMSVQDRITGEWSSPIQVEPKMRADVYRPEVYFVCCLSHQDELRQREFGPHLVVIDDPNRFLARLQSGLPHSDVVGWGLVQYFDRLDFNDIWRRDDVWLCKPRDLAWQREFRIAIAMDGIPDPDTATAKIRLGDMSDVAGYTYDP